ncbi:VOC family protein [Actinoplanes sp. NPDC051633]|uniref:VOC family protein n=1 Tax=Actinoplanes sp. NPDC051633 TaxID=3155670 RepID=UPI003445D4E8
MAAIRDIVVDCSHPASVARFWAAVLDDYAVAPYTEEELARIGGDPENDPSVLVEPAGDGPRFFFVLVPEAKTVKNRLHLDLRAEDFDAELDRLIGLGAMVFADLPEWTVLQDPEGNEFCLLKN